MTDIPRAVLSEHFQDRMKERRLVSAVFTTFRFEPGFFESEVLPVFFDIPLSHAPAIKLVQLEEALRSVPGSIAVYYDQNGLVPEGGSAKLDVRRIPVRHRTGIFHPKNVLALVEAAEPDANGHRPRALLCACLSANLTRAGWWENVEVAHVEEIREGDFTRVRDDLDDFLKTLISRTREKDDEDHRALRKIREFLRSTSQRAHRSNDGRLHTHFHNGRTSLPDFIAENAERAVHGMCLEVISPYFDSGGHSAPLEALLDRFEPREVRVYLPKNDRSEALCSEDLFAWVRTRPNVSWATLPGELLRLGRSEDTKHRAVHAKVYRFFDPTRGGREILYVGSTNLTQPGCGEGGNWESGFLVEATAAGRPDWWMTSDTRRPGAFAVRGEDEGTATSGGTQLALRYRWDRHEVEVYWGDTKTSPPLALEHANVSVIELGALAPRQWTKLDQDAAERIRRVLTSTSFFHVRGEAAEPALLLVQEEGMSHRPSLLLDLSAADILRYWALLTVEQRTAFIATRAKIEADDDPLVAKLAPLIAETTLFDRFAGIFHAFECLEVRVRSALDEHRTRDADCRLFGKKYDSLGSLLGRVLADSSVGKDDRVEQYVMTLCARQLLREVARAHPEYWAEHRDDVRRLEGQLTDAGVLRVAIAERDPEMPAFLDWFDHWFLRRAAALTEEAT